MRIVLDSNVLLAAFISRGMCAELFEHCAIRHRLFTSGFILHEVRSKLTGKLRMPPERVEAYERLLRARCALVIPAEGLPAVCRDPDDDVVLATAVAARSDCLLTGDKDLLVLGSFEEIPILKPGEFWAFESGFSEKDSTGG